MTGADYQEPPPAPPLPPPFGVGAGHHRPHRPDGRTTSTSTLRPLSCELSCLGRADGSATLSSGQTSVLAAVYGPCAPKSMNREDYSRATITVVFRHGVKQQQGSGGGGGGDAASYGAKEREVERFIGQSLTSSVVDVHKYPRTVIEVVLQVLTSDGSVVGVAWNAAIAALLDAGIHMRLGGNDGEAGMMAIPIATTIACFPETRGEGGSSKKVNGGEMAEEEDPSTTMELRLDPVAEEETSSGERSPSSVVVLVTTELTSGGGSSVVASLTSCHDNAASPVPPMMSIPTYLSCIEASHRASRAVREFLRMAVEQKVTRECQTLWTSMKELITTTTTSATR